MPGKKQIETKEINTEGTTKTSCYYKKKNERNKYLCS
jgi:hypothetical protein